MKCYLGSKVCIYSTQWGVERLYRNQFDLKVL